MKSTANKSDFLSTAVGVLAAAITANLLWGSAAPCIKLGYRYFAIASEDVMSQILFAGVRFTLAGILTILLGSLLRGKNSGAETQFRQNDLHAGYDADGYSVYLFLYRSLPCTEL